MKHRFPLFAATCALALVACQKTNDEDSNAEVVTADNMAVANAASVDTTIDAAFVNEGLQGDNGEVAIGQLAQAQGSSQKVKDFGKMLEADHGAHKDKLAALATDAGVPVPDGPSPEGKANMDKLKALNGDAFDKAFKQMMIDDHQKDIAKYEKQASSGDAKTAALAKDTLPTLKKHLEAAQGL